MLGPFLYDTRRTLTSKSVLIAMAAMVLLSLAAFGSFSTNAIPPNNNNTSQIFVYYNSSGYHFIALAWTEFGRPAAGVKFDLNVTIPAVPPRTVSGSAVTNSSGSTQFTIAVPESNSYSVGVVVTASGSSVIVSGDYRAILKQYPSRSDRLGVPHDPLPIACHAHDRHGPHEYIIQGHSGVLGRFQWLFTKRVPRLLPIPQRDPVPERGVRAGLRRRTSRDPYSSRAEPVERPASRHDEVLRPGPPLSSTDWESL